MKSKTFALVILKLFLLKLKAEKLRRKKRFNFALLTFRLNLTDFLQFNWCVSFTCSNIFCKDPAGPPESGTVKVFKVSLKKYTSWRSLVN